MLREETTEKIIGAFYKVYNTLGYGFLEKVYENAMVIELLKSELKVEPQKNIKVFYDNEEIGDYYADLLVDEKVIVELKAATDISQQHEAQRTNYLRATHVEVGLLPNFGKSAQFKRKVFQNKFKKLME